MFKRKENKKILYWSEAPSFTIDANDRWNAWCEYPAIQSADIITGLPKNYEAQHLSTFQERKDAFINMPEVANGLRRSKRGWLFEWSDWVRSYKHPTIKKCPSVVALLSKCILIKAPCDLAVTKYGDFYAADQELVSVSSHSKDQYSYPQSTLSNWWHFKLAAHIGLAPQFKTSILSFDPMYHRMNPWRVMMGNDVGTYAESETITINILVPESISEVQLKRNDPIAYYFIDEQNVTFEETKTQKKILRQLEFWQSTKPDYIRGK